MPVLSIIVPAHNAEKHLTTCIESILDQTYTDFELIIVNDGSTDGSEKICNDLMSTDDRIITINQENLGVSAARNAGLDAAAGTYIGFVDADDTIDPDMYELLISNAINHNVDIAICGIRRIATKKISIFGGTNQINILNRGEGVSKFFEKKIQGSVYEKIFKSELINQIRFEGKHYEDVLFTFQALCKSKKTAFIDIPKYNYFSHENSVSKQKFSKNHIDTVLFSQQIVEIASKKMPDYLEEAKALDFVMNISLLNLILLNNKRQYKSDLNMVKYKLDHYSKSTKIMNSLNIKYKVAYYIFKTNKRLYMTLLKLHGRVIGNAAIKLS